MPTPPQPLPCPFCGHVGLDFNEEGSTFRWAEASCAGCGASTGEVRKHDGWRDDAIAAWNCRAEVRAGIPAEPVVGQLIKEAAAIIDALVRVSDTRLDRNAELFAVGQWKVRLAGGEPYCAPLDALEMRTALTHPAQEQTAVQDERVQSCGCVLCACKDEHRCHGCGAKFCDQHGPAAARAALAAQGDAAGGTAA